MSDSAHPATRPEAPPDSEHRGLVGLLPRRIRPFAILARFDRPIGWWLLFWPGAWGVLLAGGADSWQLIAWLLLGAIAMRGAGCVYNDIVDRDLDAKVVRTASRPVASGAISLRAAWLWLIALSLIGLIVLLQLRWQAQLVALASLAPVAAYPFMKRITWWPQAWLGLVFSWAALVGWIALRDDHLAALALLYGGSIAWVIGYDTIYALQDVEDDALIGVRSSARALGRHVTAGVAVCYLIALAAWAGAFATLRNDPFAAMALIPLGAHLGWQVTSMRANDPATALRLFRSNRSAGALMAAACFVVGNA